MPLGESDIAQTVPSEQLRLSLTKCDLLAALDSQIKFVSEAQRNEGWTRWAIWGALAAFVWQGTELVTHTEFILSRSILISFAVFIIWSALENLIRLIAPSSRIAGGPVRFHQFTDLAEVIRPGVTASALRHALIIVALVCFHYPGLWPLWAYSILSLTGDLLVFSPFLKDLSYPTKFGIHAAFNSITFASVIWLVFVAAYIVSLIHKNFQEFSLVDFRFALLVNAGTYLLIHLATATTSSHVLNELTELRQHLAFDRIAVSEANKQAEKLLNGLKLTEVINPSLELVLKESKELTQMLNHSNNGLIKIRAQASADIESPPGLSMDESIRTDAFRRFDDLDVEAKRLNVKLKSVRRAQSRFQIRALGIALYSRESAPELKLPIEKVQEVFKQANQGVKEFHKRLTALKLEVSRNLGRNLNQLF